MTLAYFSLFTGILFLLTSLVLFFKKSVFIRANRILALIFLLMTIYGFLMLLLNHAQRFQSVYWLTYYFEFDLLVGMFIGPLFYFYVQFLLNEKLTLQQVRIWPHVLPFIPALVYVIAFASLPKSERVARLLADYNSIGWIKWGLTFLFYLQLLIYFGLCLRMIRKYRVKNFWVARQGNRSKIKWLYLYIWVAFVTILICAPISLCQKCDAIYTLLGMLIIDFFILFYFIYSIWNTGFINHLEQEMVNSEGHHLVLDEETLKVYHQKLLRAIDEHKIYLNESCSLAEVANVSTIPIRHLSYYINNHLQKNFSDFINEFRVHEACRQLHAEEKRIYTLEAIGLQCGFGSRSSFTRAFQKHIGKSPKEYRKSLPPL